MIKDCINFVQGKDYYTCDFNARVCKSNMEFTEHD